MSQVEYRVVSLDDGRKVALGKKDSGTYVVQFARPLEKDDDENTKTSTVEAIDGRLVTAMTLSPEALRALVALYIEDMEKQNYEIQVDIKFVEKGKNHDHKT